MLENNNFENIECSCNEHGKYNIFTKYDKCCNENYYEVVFHKPYEKFRVNIESYFFKCLKCI